MKISNKNQITKENLTYNIELVVDSVECIGSRTAISKGLTEFGKVVYMKIVYVQGLLEDVAEFDSIFSLKKSIRKIAHY